MSSTSLWATPAEESVVRMKPSLKSSLKNYKVHLVFYDSQVTQLVKHLPAMRQTKVRSLGQEDPLKKKMATHSSTLAWEIPWMEEPAGLQSMGLQRVGLDSTERFHFHFLQLYHSTITDLISELGGSVFNYLFLKSFNLYFTFSTGFPCIILY